MLGSDGLGLDLAVIEGLFGKDEFLYVLVVHDDELHHLPQDRLLQQLPLSRLLHPLQVPVQEVYHREGGCDDSVAHAAEGYHSLSHL
jgi:hypothetical protein